MYEKFALSLRQSNKYEINIIGYFAENIDKHSGIRFFPIFRFGRRSFKRVLAPIHYFQILLKVKPEIIITNTHELLLVTCLYKILFGVKFIYDIQENYYLNILKDQFYPVLIKWFLALYVRANEWLALPMTDHFLLAEKAYEKELPFIKSKYTVILNKYQPIHTVEVNKEPPPPWKFLISGTLSESYGLFEGIKFYKQLSDRLLKSKLIIIGYCAHQKTAEKLFEITNEDENIEIIGGNRLVPHREILVEIKRAHFALALYQPKKHLIVRFPTKFYEYMAHQLPILIPDYPQWADIIDRFNAGVSIDIKNMDYQKIADKIKAIKFYQNGVPGNILWKSEEPKFSRVVQNYLE